MNLLNNCITARSAPQILSKKDECTFFSNFLIIDFANSLFCMILFLTALPEVFYQKTYKPLKLGLSDIHHILDI